jgi:hypothetical protein
LDILIAIDHLNPTGLIKLEIHWLDKARQVIAIIAHLNFKFGLSDLLNQAFPIYFPISSPESNPERSNIIINWGLTYGDGLVLPRKNSNSQLRLGERVTYGMSIYQLLISLSVLDAIKSFLWFLNSLF